MFCFIRHGETDLHEWPANKHYVYEPAAAAVTKMPDRVMRSGFLHG